MSISTFLDTQESFQEAKMKDMYGGDFLRNHMSERKWPILDNSVNSGNGRPEVVCHLLSSCEHCAQGRHFDRHFES